jgi:hypothetical protein
MLWVVNLEERIPREHPLRRIKQMAELALKDLSPIFDESHSVLGRPSIPPERLLKASLLMALYTIRSERLFCEQLDYNLLFRWFLNLEQLIKHGRARLESVCTTAASCCAIRPKLTPRRCRTAFRLRKRALDPAGAVFSDGVIGVGGEVLDQWRRSRNPSVNSISAIPRWCGR